MTNDQVQFLSELRMHRSILERILQELNTLNDITIREQTAVLAGPTLLHFDFPVVSLLINNINGSQTVNVYPNGGEVGSPILSVPAGKIFVLNLPAAKQVVYVDNPCVVIYANRPITFFSN
ncbi:MAG: hypothetical protein QXI12_06690 [Candidatus Methanomethyliaceae archaeon]